MGKIGSINSAGVNAVTLTQVAQSSQSRWGIEFYLDTGIAYITDNPGAVVGVGIPVSPAQPLKLNFEDHGDLVKHAFFASMATGTGNLGVVPIESVG